MLPSNWHVAMWLRLQEPRVITLLQTFIYLLCAGAGLATVLSPPSSIEGQFGMVTTLAWGWIAVVGGVAGALSCPTGKWLVEKPALVLCITATTIYGGISLTLHLQESGNRLPQFLFIMIALFYFLARFVHIRPFSYQPGK